MRQKLSTLRDDNELLNAIRERDGDVFSIQAEIPVTKAKPKRKPIHPADWTSAICAKSVHRGCDSVWCSCGCHVAQRVVATLSLRPRRGAA